jgi:hypothetical protein
MNVEMVWWITVNYIEIKKSYYYQHWIVLIMVLILIGIKHETESMKK